MTDFDDRGLLYSGGRESLLGGQSQNDQRSVKRPLIVEEDDSDDESLRSSGGPRILKRGHPAIPQYRPEAPASKIRKDSFGSYFNPANWFKWGKERKLARQAAKAIDDPQGRGAALGPKHWAALSTTHGQRILKKQAKSSAKSDATGWNSKIEAFQRNQFRNRQWEQYGHQAVGSYDAWNNGGGRVDYDLPMPEGRVFDDRVGNLYPQGDGFDWNATAPMSADELSEAKSGATALAKFEGEERTAARKAAKHSPPAPFTSSGDMLADIEALDPTPAEEGAGSGEIDKPQPVTAPQVRDSLDDDDDQDLEGYAPQRLSGYQGMDESAQQQYMAKLFKW